MVESFFIIVIMLIINQSDRFDNELFTPISSLKYIWMFLVMVEGFPSYPKREAVWSFNSCKATHGGKDEKEVPE